MAIGLSLGLGLGARSGTSLAAQVAALFGPSDTGWFYDNSDFSTMFQDSAGTIPVTAVGQSVGLQLDKSGNGNHRFQATSLNRPILAQDASWLYYLSYDGVNDSLATSAFGWGTNKATVVAGYTRKNTSLTPVCEFSQATTSNAGSFYIFVNDSGGRIHSSASRGSAPLNISHLAGWTTAESLPTTSVISATHDIAGDLSTLRKNGVAGTNGTFDKGTGNFGNYPGYFGARGGTSHFFLGDEYSQFAINRLLTENELELVERYTNSRTGAY